MTPPTSLPPNSPMAERIAHVYPELTKALRQFANFVVAEPVNTARLSIHGVAAHVGVSVATANRLAHALGFDGYAEFRAELIRSFEPAFAPVERLVQNLNARSSASEVMIASLQEDIRNLEATIRRLSSDGCAATVRAILRARRVFVLGMSNGGHLAALIANGLDIYRDNIDSLWTAGGGATAARRLRRYGPEDLLIAIAFPRYMADTITIARDTRAQGVPILAITDSPSSPLASLTDLILYVTSDRQFASNSDASVLAVGEALVAAVMHGTPNAPAAADEHTRSMLRWLETHSTPGRMTAKRTVKKKS